MSKKIKVFYDGKCNICKKEIDFYCRIDKDKNFDWVNIHKNKGEITNTGLSKKELLSLSILYFVPPFLISKLYFDLILFGL